MPLVLHNPENTGTISSRIPISITDTRIAMPPPPTCDQIHTIHTILRETFGFSQFRDNQEDIIQAILAGRDVFAVMPTGGGKSLCYQVPAIALKGTCIVISPLISLMKDQVDNARAQGIRAGFINSTLMAEERQRLLAKVRAGELDLLYLAPERLAVSQFSNLLGNAPIAMIAVDEAHCISEWGHDFRPDYLQLTQLRRLMPGVPISAFTATATKRVQEDIIRRLRLDNPFKVRASFNRPNLFYSVQPRQNILSQLRTVIESRPTEPGIIYRLSRKDVERTAAHLRDCGIRALPYHAGLDAMQRMKNQEAFNRDEVQVIVATVAFGMGIDKSNVRFVLHGDLPKNMESYYQETGRAGRDGEPALCLLFYNRGDMARIGWFIDQLTDERERKIAWDKLKRMVEFAEELHCRRRQLLHYFDEELPGENCGGCDICRQGVEEIEATREAQMLMSAIYRTGQTFGAGHIVDIVTGSRSKKILRLGHDRIKTHGVGRHKPKTFWHRLTDTMLHRQLLTTDGERFPILKLTPAGEDVLFGRATFTMRRLKEDKKAVPASEPVTATRLPKPNAELFTALAELRRRIATEENVPPFVIFSDRSLREMCCILPNNEEEFLAIHGVGKAKLSRYGDRFLDAIAQERTTHPDLQPTAPIPHTPPAPKTGRPAVSETVMISGSLAAQGLSLAEIAAKRQLKISTIAAHLGRYLSLGHSLDIDHLVPPELQARLTKEFKQQGMEFLKPVVEALEGAVGYEEAHIVRGYLQGKALAARDRE